MLERVHRDVSDITYRAQAEPGQEPPGLLPHTPQRRHGQRVQEIEDAIRGHHQEPVRLTPGRRELGDELAAGHADGAGDALLVPDAGPDQLRYPDRRAKPPDGTRDVEESLVECERFDLRGNRPEGRHDLPG